MINLQHRSYRKELMDGDNISFEAMARTLKELNIINTRLGGHAITITGVRELTGRPSSLTIAEIGCGGGDNLFAIYQYYLKKISRSVLSASTGMRNVSRLPNSSTRNCPVSGSAAITRL